MPAKRKAYRTTLVLPGDPGYAAAARDPRSCYPGALIRGELLAALRFREVLADMAAAMRVELGRAPTAAELERFVDRLSVLARHAQVLERAGVPPAEVVASTLADLRRALDTPLDAEAAPD